MAVTPKANGDVRICVDLSKLNKRIFILKEIYPLPTVDFMLGTLSDQRCCQELLQIIFFLAKKAIRIIKLILTTFIIIFFCPSQFANIFLTYQTFVTNLHLLRVGLRCKLPGKLHRVTGPLAHHVVLNHTFELLINTAMLF